MHRSLSALWSKSAEVALFNSIKPIAWQAALAQSRSRPPFSLFQALQNPSSHLHYSNCQSTLFFPTSTSRHLYIPADYHYGARFPQQLFDSQNHYKNIEPHQTMGRLELVNESKCFDGWQKVFKHRSPTLMCDMKFSIYLPPGAEESKVPLLIYLSGLACNEQNFIKQSGFQKYASKHKIAVLCPDTSPRGDQVPDDELWYIGQGVGFYVDATKGKWAKNYKMYTYIIRELFDICKTWFKSIDSNNASIMGHSMGGNGAIVMFLRNPHIFKSVSAISPISNPSNSPWARKVFEAYLGDDPNVWAHFDATELVRRQPQRRTQILIDQGSRDEFLHEIKPGNFIEACRDVNQSIVYNFREGYDHSYFYISTFIESHFDHHAKALNGHPPPPSKPKLITFEERLN